MQVEGADSVPLLRPSLLGCAGCPSLCTDMAAPGNSTSWLLDRVNLHRPFGESEGGRIDLFSRPAIPFHLHLFGDFYSFEVERLSAEMPIGAGWSLHF